MQSILSLLPEAVKVAVKEHSPFRQAFVTCLDYACATFMLNKGSDMLACVGFEVFTDAAMPTALSSTVQRPEHCLK